MRMSQDSDGTARLNRLDSQVVRSRQTDNSLTDKSVVDSLTGSNLTDNSPTDYSVADRHTDGTHIQ